ncbi:hypothetical protein lpymt_01973 [Legionella pneumophila]|nr:hypothetical protein lpymt_01973 [Legionella pneumophila]
MVTEFAKHLIYKQEVLVKYTRYIVLTTLMTISLCSFSYDMNEKFYINGAGESLTIRYKPCGYIDGHLFCVDEKSRKLSIGEKLILNRNEDYVITKIIGSAGIFDYPSDYKDTKSIKLSRSIIGRFGKKYFIYSPGY